MLGGEVGSTVSRNLTSARSSIRAPFSLMLPMTLGVSILTRGDSPIATSRLTTGATVAAGACGVGALLPGCGAVLDGEVVSVGFCGDFCNWACACCCARCRSVCGTL